MPSASPILPLLMQEKPHLLTLRSRRQIDVSFITSSPSDAEGGDGKVSLALSIDEIRWLHASESMSNDDDHLQHPMTTTITTTTASTLNSTLGSNSNSEPASTAPHVGTLPPTSIHPSPSPLMSSSSPSLSPDPTITNDDVIAPPPQPPLLRPRMKPADGSNLTWAKHRHYHFGVDDEEEEDMPPLVPPKVERLPSSSSTLTSLTTTTIMTPTNRKPSSSLIPAPIAVPVPVPQTPSGNSASLVVTPGISRSLPIPQRTEWIYRSPRRIRPPLVPSLSVSATTSTRKSPSSSPTTPTRKPPSPPTSSPTSRLPVSVSSIAGRTRTCPTSPHVASVAQPLAPPISASSSSGIAKRPRPQTGYGAFGGPSHATSHANASFNAGGAEKVPAVVRSSLPARTTTAPKKSGKDKEKGKDKPFWSRLKSSSVGSGSDSNGDGNEEENGENQEEFPDGSPSSRIMDIVNCANAAREQERNLLESESIKSRGRVDRENEKEREKDKDKDEGKRNRLRKARGLHSLVIGKGRPSTAPATMTQAQERTVEAVEAISSSLSSSSTADTDATQSSSSTATPYNHSTSFDSTSTVLDISHKTSTTTTTTTLKSTRSSPPPSIPPPSDSASVLARNRASSSSSNSSASTTGTSAHSTSTAATSPSPSITAKPPLPVPSTPSSTRTSTPILTPTKSILTRSASTSSSTAHSSRPRLVGLFQRGASGGSGSGNSSAKSVTFVEEPTVHYPEPHHHRYSESDAEGEWFTSSHASGSEEEEQEEYKPHIRRHRIMAEADKTYNTPVEDWPDDMTGVGSARGLSKAALVWEMGVDVDDMDFSCAGEGECEDEGDVSMIASDYSSVDDRSLWYASVNSKGTTVNLDTPLELDMGQGYVLSSSSEQARRIHGGIEEESEEDLMEDGEEGGESGSTKSSRKGEKGATNLKRILSLKHSSTSSSTSNCSTGATKNPSSTASFSSFSRRPTISGPYALGSLPPPSSFRSTSLSSRSPSPIAGRSTTSLRSTGTSHLDSRFPTTSLNRARSNSSSSSRHMPNRPATGLVTARYYTNHHSTLPSIVPTSSFSPNTFTNTATGTWHHKSHSYSHPMVPPKVKPHRLHVSAPSLIPAPASSKFASKPVVLETTSPVSSECNNTDGGPMNFGPTSLRAAPSLESCRSAAGRSVRSLGSIRSTASTRGFRAWLGRVSDRVVGFASKDATVEEGQEA